MEVLSCEKVDLFFGWFHLLSEIFVTSLLALSSVDILVHLVKDTLKTLT